MTDFENLSDRLEGQPAIPLHEYWWRGLALEQASEAALERFKIHRILAKEDRSVTANRDDYLFTCVLLVGMVIREGQQYVNATLEHGCDHHENDEEHQHNVHKRGDVDLAF